MAHSPPGSTESRPQIELEAGTTVSRDRAGNPTRDMHYFCMSKRLLALLLLATPAFAQEHPTAYQALRTVGTQLNRDFVNHVILVSGLQWRSAARDVAHFAR